MGYKLKILKKVKKLIKLLHDDNEAKTEKKSE